MPKPIRAAKKDEYIRFRPYHVFATPSTESRRVDRRKLAGVLLLVGVFALLLIGAIVLFHRH